MTNSRLQALVIRRLELIEQIAYERAALAQNAEVLQRLARIIDRVGEGIHYLKVHPATMILPAIIAAVARPWRWLSLAAGGFGLWRIVARIRHRLIS
jgi:YqjK-like protein